MKITSTHKTPIPIPSGRLFFVLANKNPIHGRTPIRPCEKHLSQSLRESVVRNSHTESVTIDGFPALVWDIEEDGSMEKRMTFRFTCETVCLDYCSPHSMWDFALYYTGDLGKHVVLYRSSPLKVVNRMKKPQTKRKQEASSSSSSEVQTTGNKQSPETNSMPCLAEATKGGSSSQSTFIESRDGCHSKQRLVELKKKLGISDDDFEQLSLFMKQ